jgi:hypothetical protein
MGKSGCVVGDGAPGTGVAGAGALGPGVPGVGVAVPGTAVGVTPVGAGVPGPVGVGVVPRRATSAPYSSYDGQGRAAPPKARTRA